MRPLALPVILALLVTGLSTAPALATWDDGVAAFQSGRYDEAVEAFRNYLAQSPEASQAHFMLGRSLLKTRQVSAALASFDKAVELDAGNLDYRLAYAQLQFKAKRFDDALGTLAAQDPATLPDNRRNSYETLLVNAATEGADDALAARALERALQANPRSKVMWQTLAATVGEYDPARKFEALTKAFEIDTTDLDAGRDAARSALFIAQTPGMADAKTWYAQALGVAKRLGDTAEDHRLRGEAHLGLQQIPEARQAFERAKPGMAKDPAIHYYLASCALAEKRPQDAIALLDTADTLGPNDTLAQLILFTRASALRHLERFDDAATVYAKLGRPEKVAEMKQLRADQAQNAQWEADKRDCESRRDKLEALLAESEDLKGTAVWDELQSEHTAVVEACKGFLDA